MFFYGFVLKKGNLADVLCLTVEIRNGFQTLAPVATKTCVLRLEHLLLSRQTLVSDVSNTCVCRDKGLCLSNGFRAVGAKACIESCIYF